MFEQNLCNSMIIKISAFGAKDSRSQGFGDSSGKAKSKKNKKQPSLDSLTPRIPESLIPITIFTKIPHLRKRKLQTNSDTQI